MQGTINHMISQVAGLKKLSDISVKPIAQKSKTDAVHAKVLQNNQKKTPKNMTRRQRVKARMKGGK